MVSAGSVRFLVRKLSYFAGFSVEVADPTQEIGINRQQLRRLDFYLEARGWPSEFIFDHEQEIATHGVWLPHPCPAGISRSTIGSQL